MIKHLDKVEDVINVLGVSLGLSQIETILGIIVLVVNLLSILVRYGFKIYEHYKQGKINNIADDLEEAGKKIEELKEGDKND